jgi:hypothetical protein
VVIRSQEEEVRARESRMATRHAGRWKKSVREMGKLRSTQLHWEIVINKRVYTATAEAKTLFIRSFILQLRAHIGGFK